MKHSPAGAEAPAGDFFWGGYVMLRLGAGWLLATVLFTSGAYAHGGVSVQDNKCIMKIGPDTMYFTGYQPQFSRQEFCDDIPNAGQMVVALDMQDRELRDMTTEIRIIKDEGTHTTLNGYPYLTDAELGDTGTLGSKTVFFREPKKYPTGTLTFEHNFPETGKFIGIVTVKNDHGQTYVSQFPFTVGTPYTKTFTIWGILAAVVCVAGFALWRFSLKKG
jgi:hypothetical protein